MSRRDTKHTTENQPSRVTQPRKPARTRVSTPEFLSQGQDEGELVSRRDFLKTAAFAGLLVVAGRPFAMAQDQTPTKVGFILPKEGPLAAEAASLLSGFEFRLSELGAGAPPLEILKQDSGDNDSKTLEAVAELVVNQKVQFLVSPPSYEGAIKTIHGLAGAQPILFVTNPCVALVAGEKCLPNAFRLRPNTYQTARPLAPWALKNVGMKIFLTGDDDAQGNEQADYFAYGFDKAGGMFVDRMMVPASSADMDAVIKAIAESGADLVFASFQNESAIAFLKAVRAAADVKQPIVGPDSLASFPKTVASAGENCLGVRTLTSLKSPEDFVAAIKGKLKADVSNAERAAEGYDIATVISETAKKMAQTNKFDLVIKFVEEMEVQGPRGKVRFDANHEPIVDVMVQEWLADKRNPKQKILANLGTCRSLDFGCGRVGFPRRPEEETGGLKQEESQGGDVLWDE